MLTFISISYTLFLRDTNPICFHLEQQRLSTRLMEKNRFRYLFLTGASYPDFMPSSSITADCLGLCNPYLHQIAFCAKRHPNTLNFV